MHHLHKHDQSFEAKGAPIEANISTVVMVSTLQAECSQSIHTASKPSGAMNLAVGTLLKPRYRPKRGGILPSCASRNAWRVL